MPVELQLTPSIATYDFVTTLNDADFVIEMAWADRSGAWFMSLSTTAGEIIFSGVKVVIGAFLGRRSTNPRGPAGFFVVEDTSGANLDAGFDDMGVRVRVLFFTGEEFFALGA